MLPITKRSTLLGLLLCTSLALSAQIGISSKAKDLLKDKKTEKPKENPSRNEPSQPENNPAKPTTTPAATGKTGSGKSRETPVEAAQASRSKPSEDARYKPSDVELDFNAEPFAPSIVWASLLSENSWYFNITNGEMSLRSLEASFLPKKTTSGTDVRYESYSNKTPLLRMEVVDTKSGNILTTMHYEAKPATAPFYDMEVLEGYDYKTHVQLVEGSYELRFWAGNKPFYTFPFSVEKKTNADPYAPVHDFYFLKGAWSDWGRVEFGPDGHFMFNFYLSDESTTVPNQARWDVSKEYKYLVKLYRDGKMVAVHSLDNMENTFSEGDLQTSNGKWKHFDCTLHAYPPAGKGNGAGSRAFFMKNDLKDGNYTAEVWLKDKAGVETTHKYGFTVKNAAIVAPEKADRAQNKDPLQFLEQGPGKFYVRKI